MLVKLKAYWQSKQSNIHALITFLGGSGGMFALAKVQHGFKGDAADFICGAAMILGALLYTPQ